MTQVRMYVRVADRLRLLYQLLSRKILPRGMRAFIFVPDEAEAARVDEYLWTASAAEFLPHARAESEAAADSPAVVATSEPAADWDCGGVLVFWGAEAPPFFGRFETLADITENRPAEMRAARARYKFYQAHGYPIDLHEMDKSGG